MSEPCGWRDTHNSRSKVTVLARNVWVQESHLPKSPAAWKQPYPSRHCDPEDRKLSRIPDPPFRCRSWRWFVRIIQWMPSAQLIRVLFPQAVGDWWWVGWWGREVSSLPAIVTFIDWQWMQQKKFFFFKCTYVLKSTEDNNPQYVVHRYSMLTPYISSNMPSVVVQRR